MGRSTIARLVATYAIAGLVVAYSSAARADCMPVEPRAIEGRVQSCNAVDLDNPAIKRSKEQYRGLFVELDDGHPKTMPTWIPEREGKTCKDLAIGWNLKATLSHACCDGDPNPPCQLRTSAILTKVTASPPSAPPPSAQPSPAQPSPTPAPSPSAAPPPTTSPSPPPPSTKSCGCELVGGARDDASRMASIASIALVVLARRRRGGQPG